MVLDMQYEDWNTSQYQEKRTVLEYNNYVIEPLLAQIWIEVSVK